MNEDDHEEDEVPDDMQEYSELSVFNKTKFSEKEVKKNEVQVVGDVTLSGEEKEILRLHNKLSVLENLKPGGLDPEQEAAVAKLRMEKVKEKEYEGFSPEEREELEMIDSKARMIYDPLEKVYDNRRRRVTDLRECIRIILPKPLNPDEESKIKVRKRTQKEVYEKYVKKHTNKQHEQKSNLTKSEKEGLKSLIKRINKLGLSSAKLRSLN